MISFVRASSLSALLLSLASNVDGVSIRGAFESQVSASDHLSNILDTSCIMKNTEGDNSLECLMTNDKLGMGCYSCDTIASEFGVSQNACMTGYQKDLALKQQKTFLGGRQIISACEQRPPVDDTISVEASEDDILDTSCILQNKEGDNTDACLAQKDMDGNTCFSCQTILADFGKDQNVCMNKDQKDKALELQTKFLPDFPILTDCTDTKPTDDYYEAEE